MIYKHNYLHRVFTVEICADGGPCGTPDCGLEHAVIDVVPKEKYDTVAKSSDRQSDLLRRFQSAAVVFQIGDATLTGRREEVEKAKATLAHLLQKARRCPGT